MEEPLFTLNVKICSARGLRLSCPKAWVQVCVKVGANEFATAFKKYYSRNLSTVFWNKTFKCSIRNESALILSVKTKKNDLLGRSVIHFPQTPGEFQDRWDPLEPLPAAGEKPAEIHFVLQLEQLAQIYSSPRLALEADQLHKGNLAAEAAHFANLSGETQYSQVAAQQGGRAGGKGSAANTRTRTVVNSHFDNHATAATMNELIESLQEVKRIIECEDPKGLSSRDRIAQLSQVKEQLKSIRSQIEQEAFLEEAWKQRFVAVTEAYASELSIILATAAWAGVGRRSHSLSQSGAGQVGSAKQSGKKAFVPVLKSHVIPSIESFDDLIDKGFATTVLSNGDGEVPLAFGMTAEISYQAFLWDPARAIMLSFADSCSSGNLSFVLADDDEEEQEVPYGLRLGLLGLVENATFSITISPPFAYGESGGNSGNVPPNTHVLYEGRVVKVEGSEQTPAGLSRGSVKRDSSTQRQTFAARSNRVSISTETSLSPPRRAPDDLPHVPEFKGHRKPQARSSLNPPPIPPRKK